MIRPPTYLAAVFFDKTSIFSDYYISKKVVCHLIKQRNGNKKILLFCMWNLKVLLKTIL